ncbi:hypothetical protein [Shewanella phaeophyticola]|uniref:Uncharacterized protein n=1 Tax=Shewanella phaeophyticola TaxID=2978345 RepID=A0ABT2P5N6_9GAMM|nr:hypothetical protein [Shewanella sp. KJ10-1]MCT8987963.1 hypothetical protein [Shewanella sp. KJ10-1]
MNISPFIDIVEDLNRDLAKSERYLRLIQAIQRAIPCDAVVLLKLKHDYLMPVAVVGLTLDAMQAGSFDALNPTETRAYIAGVAAAIKTREHIEALEAKIEQSHQVAQATLWISQALLVKVQLLTITGRN